MSRFYFFSFLSLFSLVHSLLVFLSIALFFFIISLLAISKFFFLFLYLFYTYSFLFLVLIFKIIKMFDSHFQFHLSFHFTFFLYRLTNLTAFSSFWFQLQFLSKNISLHVTDPIFVTRWWKIESFLRNRIKKWSRNKKVEFHFV